ncbi:hypothetical protein BG003_004819 [Podila horticola]|nr:hypothetical protein BG003_004819 [Podila horticola]
MDPAHHQSSSSGPVHCFWALMTYGDLRFIYLSSSVQRAVSAKYKQLLGQSFFDYIHPDEAKLARKDLNAFMDVHNLYGSVTRCRFKNVCPEWQQRRLSRQKTYDDDPSPTDSAAILQAAATEGGLSSRGLGQGGLHNETTQSTNTTTNNDDKSAPQGDDVVNECKDYDDLFPNGDADDFMILDVVMNVVSDEVVLGFFHIDGQGLYKGFWSNGICGESKESLPTLAPEILRHLQDSAHSKANTQDNRTDGSPPSSPRRQSDNKTKRIFQLYDSQHRNLLLTWPEPSGNQSKDANAMVYNPELYTHIVKSHHIPTDALENTTCLKRFCSKHALPSLNPSSQEPSYQVESVFIPYGHIIFACFQTSPSTPTSTWGSMSSPSTSITTPNAHPAVSTPGRTFGSTDVSSDHLSGLGLLPSPGQLSSSMFPLGSSSPSNQPLVIPSLPSLSPFLKHASAGQMTMTSGAGVTSGTGAIRNSPGSAHFHPYSRTSALSASSSGSSSPSSLPLPESMQESLSFLNDYKAGDYDRESGRAGDPNENSPHSVWRASTPHPAIAAMVGHALAPSAPAFQRSVGQDPRSSSRKSFEGDGFGPNGPLGHAAEISHSGSSKHHKTLSSSHRHPAHDAVIRKRTSPTPGHHHTSSSSSPPSSHPELDSSGRKEHGHSANSHGGLVLRVNQEEKACESCHTTNSPEWRRGPSGKKDLCNACGLRYSRSVARQNRQAQKQLEGGGKPKVKTPKTPKTPKGKKGQGQEHGHEHGHGHGHGQDNRIGHYASVCTEPERLCYNCKQSGHESNLCPMPRTSDAKQCYSCGGVGHIQADCPTIRLQRNAAAGGGRCYNCGIFGHMARNCRNQLRYGTSPRNFQGDMGMGDMSSSQDASTSDGNPSVNASMAQGHQGGYSHRGRGGYMGHGRPMHMNGPPHHNNNNQNSHNSGRVVCFKCGGLNHYSRDCKANGAKCYSCGKYGHISRECPNLVGGVVDKTSKTCYRCGEHGHISRDCPTATEA